MSRRRCVDIADDGRISRVVAFDLAVHDGEQKQAAAIDHERFSALEAGDGRGDG